MFSLFWCKATYSLSKLDWDLFLDVQVFVHTLLSMSAPVFLLTDGVAIDCSVALAVEFEVLFPSFISHVRHCKAAVGAFEKGIHSRVRVEGCVEDEMSGLN